MSQITPAYELGRARRLARLIDQHRRDGKAELATKNLVNLELLMDDAFDRSESATNSTDSEAWINTARNARRLLIRAK